MQDVMALVHDLLTEFDTMGKRKDLSPSLNLSHEGGGSGQLTPQQEGRSRLTQLPDDTFHLVEDIESVLISRLDSSADTSASAVYAGKAFADLSSTSI